MAQISQTMEIDPLGCVVHIHECATVGILVLLMCCCVHLKVDEHAVFFQLQFLFNYACPFLLLQCMYKSDFSFISVIVTE